MATFLNYCKYNRKKTEKYHRRSKYMKKKIPRTEDEVRSKIDLWCQDKHPRVRIQGSECEKLIEATGEKKIIDATIIGKYKRKSRSGATMCLIAELEFEEHKTKRYGILNDLKMITIPLRKLTYWRNDIPQYWIKIDKDGTPEIIRTTYEDDVLGKQLDGSTHILMEEV